MKFIVSGKNFEITDSLRERVEKKIGKLQKFFQPDTEAHVTMTVERNRHIVEVTIVHNGMVFRAEVSNDDMYTAIDKTVDILEGQMRKNKTRLEKKLHENAFKSDTKLPGDIMEEEQEFKVVRTKRFAIKPMAVEEAILQMNLVGHEFFVFSNADTKEVNVVYKRKNGNYGLIEPEF